MREKEVHLRRCVGQARYAGSEEYYSCPSRIGEGRMIKPVRLQRSRKKGAKLVSPNGLSIIYVGRPSKWGNDFRIGIDGNAVQCVALYRSRIEGNWWTFPTKKDIERELRGKNLACFCPLDQSCHADFLLKLANRSRP